MSQLGHERPIQHDPASNFFRCAVISGNDGRRVRERARAIAGAMVRMPGPAPPARSEGA